MKTYENSITFLNMSGDVTITWDDSNRDAIKAMVEQKMKEGYTFFTVKKVPLLPLYRNVKVTTDNLDKVNSIVISDDEFDKMVKGMDDRQVAELVVGDKAQLTKRKGNKSELQAFKRAKDADEVLDNQCIGVRKLAGG